MIKSYENREGWIWMNGNFIPWKNATSHIVSQGLHYASAVFEGERAYNGKIFKFEKNDPTLFFLQRLRDEAHRFAINAHRTKRQKGIRRSLLDQVNGIGSIRKRALLNHFGSAKAVESASFDEIKSVEGVEEKVAKKIYNFFHE